MKLNGKHSRTLWLSGCGRAIEILDQSRLPHEIRVARLSSGVDVARAIANMSVRGAPLIGVAAAYGVALAMAEDSSDDGVASAAALLKATRPTAINLAARVDEVVARLKCVAEEDRAVAALAHAASIAEEEVSLSRAIGEHGAELIRAVHERKKARVNVLTHCNAGWLATVDWGTALAPVYVAHNRGIPVHVWVGETRPRNQGYLTAFELAEEGVPHTVIVDNAGGHLMQRGEVDLCLVGTDRTTSLGDVCNKIGTYLKALSAKDNGVPFYAAVPRSSIDWRLRNGLKEIPIEERSADEVHLVSGTSGDGAVAAVRVTPRASAASNHGFDVTPARLLTGLITERGVCAASPDGLLGLYPERR